MEQGEAQNQQVLARAQILFREHQNRIRLDTSRLFAFLMLFQWVAGVAAAVWVAPHTWAGTHQQIHLHVWAAIFLGAAVASLPVVLAFQRPHDAITRHVIAAAQMVWSGLLIHLTGGRIETHFHVFGSLAFLAFYRDWRVFITATLVVGLDHLVRGIFYPQSVYGVLTASPWRTVEHAAWVLFENFFLVHSCRKATAEMMEIAEKRAQLEFTNEFIEDEVAERTKEVFKLQKALQLAEVGISYLDPTGIYRSVDEVYARMIGYEPEELINESWTITVHHEDMEPAIEAYQQMKREGRGEAEVRALQKDGGQFYKRVVLVASRNEIGEFIGHYCFMTNVDQEKRHKEELRVARDEALQAAQVKSDFLANMSHEIRTPMNGVIGMTELMLDTKLNQEQRELADTVRSSAESLLCIINDILDFSKIEVGKMELSPVNFELRSLVSELERLLEVQVRRKNLEFVIQIAEEVPQQLYADAGRLRQVLTNLLSNAMKFTEERGGVLLYIDMLERYSSGVKLVFTVSDSGIGIEDQKKDKIFEAFTQADSSTTRKYGGTGLGLAISSQLVELMGGEMTVTSRVGRGSAFRFTACFESSKQEQSDKSEIDELESQLIESLRILVAEDNKVNQKLAARILEKQGHVVTIANNGSEAVSAHEESCFDLILMDIQMPIMSGEEAVAAIRKREEASGERIPIVALTANAMQGDRERYLDAGMDGYVSKPIRKAELFREIERATYRKPSE